MPVVHLKSREKKLEFVRNDWRADNGIFSVSFPHLELEELQIKTSDCLVLRSSKKQNKTKVFRGKTLITDGVHDNRESD